MVMSKLASKRLVIRSKDNLPGPEKFIDLFVWRGSAEISRPLVMRSKYDLLGEIYGAVCLEWLCRTSAEMSRRLVIRLKYELLGEIYGLVCLAWLCRK